MFITRTISGACLLAITILMVVLGGAWLLVFTAAISLIAMFELYRVFDMEKSICACIGYLAAIALYALIWFNRSDLILAVLTAAFLAVMAVYVFSYPKLQASKVIPAFFVLMYAAVMLSYIYRTRVSTDGMYTVWLIYISAWGSDTCAYLVGRAIGKHKMAPILSPKKSVEGAFGGIIGAALLGIIYASVFKTQLTEFSNPVLACALIGASGSLISMVGDLAASAIKRDYKIKDYGKLIPGHGGIMDRFDSIIFTAPVIFYLVSFLQTL